MTFDSLSLLPLELWREIAMDDLSLWRSLCLVVRGLYDDGDNRIMMKKHTTINTFPDGTVMHYLGRRLHRDPSEGPAVYSTRSPVYTYYYLGKIHRDPSEGPAQQDRFGTIRYRVHGRNHRDHRSGPAIIKKNGDVMFYWHGMLHREVRYGPALRIGDTSVYFERGQQIDFEY